MYKKTIALGLLFTVVLVIAGCGGGTSISDQGPSQVNYRTGSQGIVVNFPSNMPVRLYEGDSEIDFTLELRNRGAFPQTDVPEDEAFFQGVLYFGGYDKNIVTISQGGDFLSDLIGVGFDEDDGLEGKTSFNPDGGYTGFDFSIDVDQEFPEGFSQYNPKLKVAAIYNYATVASPSICVDPEPRSTKIRDKACTFTDSISPGPTGGPVSVSRIDQDVTRDDILFKIYVQNVGSGRVIKPQLSKGGDAINNDPFIDGFSFQDLDRVRIKSIQLGNQVLVTSACRPNIDDHVRLIDGKGIIFCQVDKGTVGIDSAFQTPLNIKLEYTYQESIETQLEITEAIEFKTT